MSLLFEFKLFSRATGLYRCCNKINARFPLFSKILLRPAIIPKRKNRQWPLVQNGCFNVYTNVFEVILGFHQMCPNHYTSFLLKIGCLSQTSVFHLTSHYSSHVKCFSKTIFSVQRIWIMVKVNIFLKKYLFLSIFHPQLNKWQHLTKKNVFVNDLLHTLKWEQRIFMIHWELHKTLLKTWINNIFFFISKKKAVSIFFFVSFFFHRKYKVHTVVLAFNVNWVRVNNLPYKIWKPFMFCFRRKSSREKKEINEKIMKTNGNSYLHYFGNWKFFEIFKKEKKMFSLVLIFFLLIWLKKQFSFPFLDCFSQNKC